MFRQRYPNLAYDDQVVALDAAGQGWYVDNRLATNEVEYVKAILNRHCGEVRLVGDSKWELFNPATGGSWLNPRFWHAQFMSDERTRAYLKQRNDNPKYRDRDLTYKEVEWILGREPDRTTAVLRWRRGISDRSCADSGSSQFGGGVIEFRRSHYVTLSELFWWARQHATALDIYRLYRYMPVWIYKKGHSVSNSEPGIMRRNARVFRNHKYGHYGLPA